MYHKVQTARLTSDNRVRVQLSEELLSLHVVPDLSELEGERIGAVLSRVQCLIFSTSFHRQGEKEKMQDGKGTHAGSAELIRSPHDGVENCSHAGLYVSEPSSTCAKSRLTSISGFSCRSRKVSFRFKNLFG
jgi:hypothetical protein